MPMTLPALCPRLLNGVWIINMAETDPVVKSRFIDSGLGRIAMGFWFTTAAISEITGVYLVSINHPEIAVISGGMVAGCMWFINNARKF